MKKITVIVKVLTTLPELAQWCMDNLGEGARPDAEDELYAFAYNNTPVQNGYIRIPCAEHIATALQWMLDEGITSEHGEIVRIEWHGQDRYPVEKEVLDEEGNPTMETVYEEQLFKVGEQDIVDEDGNVTGTRDVYLGHIG